MTMSAVDLAISVGGQLQLVVAMFSTTLSTSMQGESEKFEREREKNVDRHRHPRCCST